MKIITSKYSEPSVSLSLLLLRLTVGTLMLVNHGMKKMSNFSQMVEKGFADPFHIGAKASLGLTIFAEVFCSALIIVGLLTRFATIPLTIAMIVALFFAHAGEVFGDGEHAAIYLVIYVALFLAGPGKYSLDKKIGK